MRVKFAVDLLSRSDEPAAICCTPVPTKGELRGGMYLRDIAVPGLISI